MQASTRQTSKRPNSEFGIDRPILHTHARTHLHGLVGDVVDGRLVVEKFQSLCFDGGGHFFGRHRNTFGSTCPSGNTKSGMSPTTSREPSLRRSAKSS